MAGKVSQESVHYRPALAFGGRFCGNCGMSSRTRNPLTLTCSLVESKPGPIRPWNVCDEWIASKSDEKAATSAHNESKAA